MEYWMDEVHGVREVEFKSMQGDLLEDGKWSEELVIKLLGGPCCLDVSCG